MGSDVRRDVVATEQQRGGFEHPRCEVLGQLSADSAVDDHFGRRNQLLHLTASVRTVPRRPSRAEPRERPVDDDFSVQLPRSDRDEMTRPGGCNESQVVELVRPPLAQLVARHWDDLVRAGLGPGAPVPRLPQGRTRLLAGMVRTPAGLVAVDVGLNLSCPRAERSGVRLQLDDLAAAVVEGVAVRCQRRSELRVSHHRGVPDPVDCLEAVADPHRVQSAPRSGRLHPRVDLEMKVPVRITGT